ncbi:Phage integrase family protein [Gordonia sp. v-85]|nr:Phage integrase family protein [Gordonia sp. v-85]
MDGLLTPPSAESGRDERAVHRYLHDDVPPQFRHDITVWVRSLRGDGTRPSIPLQWVTARTYLCFALPALRNWATRYQSLREITRHDVVSELDAHLGSSLHNVRTALRSLFGRLQRENRIFVDPARGLAGQYISRVPQPLPSDQLRAAFDATHSPRDRLILALVAVHALGVKEMQQLSIDDVDLASGTIVIARRSGRHTVRLDEAVHRLTQQWLDHRHRHWPRTQNRYFFVSRSTALQPDWAMSPYGLTAVFRRVGLSASKLRADRIYDEATHTADPVVLMRVFGIRVTSAVHYVRAAHPTRFHLDPISE